MNVYEGKNIRNVGIVGHGGSGKTFWFRQFSILAQRIASAGGRWQRLTDYDEDEIERKITIATKLAFCEWNKTKSTCRYAGLRQLHPGRWRTPRPDAAIVVVDAVSGVMVQTEKSWGYAEEFQLPRLIVINRMDRDTASFERSLESVQQSLGRMCVPIQIPLGAEKGFKGVADLIQMKAHIYQTDGSGKSTESAIPAAPR